MSGDHQDGDVVRTHNYLAEYGEKLLENGYSIVPIRRGGKSPGFDGWEKARPTKAQWREWLETGFKQAGVGILTRTTPAIDLDIRDAEVAALMTTYIQEKMGGTLLRIGQAPKALFLFRTDKPFAKMRSSLRMDDEWCQRHQVEVLCEGQQAVVYHLHPDTNRPYTWPTDGQNPLEVKALDLPTLTIEQIEEMIAYFESLAEARQWKIVKKGRRSDSVSFAKNNPFVEDTAPVNLSEEECHARLLLVPNASDYEQWINVGMALNHQFDGDDRGLELWHEWSETADNYDADELDKRWADFNIHGKGRAPVTFRFIIKEAKEAAQTKAAETNLKLRDMFATARDKEAWDLAAVDARDAELDSLVRGALAQIAKDALDRILGVKNPIALVKKAIAYQPKGGEKTPGWAKPWVYDTSDDKFFETDKKIITSKMGFDAMHDRHAITKADVLDGKTKPSQAASDLALVTYKVPVVQGRRYEPGRDDIFHTMEGIYANTYTEKEIPELPEQEIPRDKKNVDRVRAHIAHLLPDEWEQRMLLDWLSYVVQNPGQHVNYAVMLQGVEGDGKSFFAEMMRAVMGVSNVQMLNAHIFESDFTDWSVGQCLSCIEEVRIVKAQNKYEVINRIKPNITNNIIEVHPKGRPIFNARNTTSYLFFSNHKDALPLDDDGRRFLVLFSQWQQKWRLDEFKTANPRYYEKLYLAIEDSPGALRKWLLEHEQHPDFKPKGDAPQTEARKFMVRQSKAEFIQTLDDIIQENESVYASEYLVNATKLSELFAARGVEIPHAKTFHSMMQRAGWESLGRMRNGDGGTERSEFWSKHPELFRSSSDGEARSDNGKIRTFIAQRSEEIDGL